MGNSQEAVQSSNGEVMVAWTSVFDSSTYAKRCTDLGHALQEELVKFPEELNMVGERGMDREESKHF